MLFLNNAHGTGGGGGGREGCTGGQGCAGGQGRVCRWSGEGVLVVCDEAKWLLQLQVLMQDLWERYYELFTTDDSSTVASLLYIYLLEHRSDIDHDDCNILEAIATNKFNEYISPSRLNG